MKRPLLTLAVFAIAVAACGVADDDAGGSTTTTGPTPTAPTAPPARDPDDVVLQVRYEGGFAPIEFVYNPMPAYTLLGDGRLIFEGPVAEIFPGPLLPHIQVAQLEEGDVARILELVAAAGLPDLTDERNDDYAANVADASNTVVTFFDDSGEHRFSVYALGIGLDPPSDPRVGALQRLVDALGTAAFSVSDVQAWQPAALQILVADSLGGETEPGAVVAPWPLDTPVADLATNVLPDVDLRCIALEGADAAEAVAAFAQAHQLTYFDDGTAVYRLVVRPILPGVTACPAG